MEFIDQLNRNVFFKQRPARIISLVPSQTELLVVLGLREKIVGITKFCVHPKDLKNEITIVGGTKKVSFNKIQSLQPDIIICNKEENTKAMVLQLEKIAPVWISNINTIAESLQMIAVLGNIFNVAENAQAVISKIESAIVEFKGKMQTTNLVNKNVLYLIWKKPFIAAGKNTFIDSLLQLNGYNNVCDGFSRYPEVGQIEFEQAELILLSTEPYPFSEEDVKTLKEELNAEVKLVDGEYFSWYGSRLIDAFQYFYTLHNL